MKKVLQGLLIAGTEMMEDVRSGKKRISIREGHRDYNEGGEILIGCHINDWAELATITSVRYTTINGLTNEELHDDGFDSKEHAIEVLSKWYEGINSDSEVTVIRWQLYDYAKPDVIRISEDELGYLQEQVALLEALQAAGVDNWEGYSEALRNLT